MIPFMRFHLYGSAKVWTPNFEWADQDISQVTSTTMQRLAEKYM